MPSARPDLVIASANAPLPVPSVSLADTGMYCAQAIVENLVILDRLPHIFTPPNTTVINMRLTWSQCSRLSTLIFPSCTFTDGMLFCKSSILEFTLPKMI
jgi:hypothetical protein